MKHCTNIGSIVMVYNNNNIHKSETQQTRRIYAYWHIQGKCIHCKKQKIIYDYEQNFDVDKSLDSLYPQVILHRYTNSFIPDYKLSY